MDSYGLAAWLAGWLAAKPMKTNEINENKCKSMKHQ